MCIEPGKDALGQILVALRAPCTWPVSLMLVAPQFHRLTQAPRPNKQGFRLRGRAPISCATRHQYWRLHAVQIKNGRMLAVAVPFLPSCATGWLLESEKDYEHIGFLEKSITHPALTIFFPGERFSPGFSRMALF